MALSLKKYSGFRKIAEGGMSEIYRAVERSTGRRVVIKKLLLEQSNRVFTMNRCENEARTAAEISHENIISIIDYGEDRGWFCIVMEYIDGCNLEGLMADRSFNRETGIMIALAALQALRAAHKKGVVHCDVKPANILIDRSGRVVLSDFGLSHARTHSLNNSGGIIDFATPLYMPPEQAKLVAEHIGLASDVWAETASIVYTDMSPDENRALRERGIQWDLWSVGVLLYRICTGNYPFNGNDLAGLLTSIVHSEAKNVRTLAGDLPPSIASVIERCLEKESYRRPHSIDPVIDALQKYIVTLDIADPAQMIAAHLAGVLPAALKSTVGFMGGGRSLGSRVVALTSGIVSWLGRRLRATASEGPRKKTPKWLPAMFNPQSRFAKPLYAFAVLIVLVIFGTLVIRERTGNERIKEPAVAVAIAPTEQKKAATAPLPLKQKRIRQPLLKTAPVVDTPAAVSRGPRIKNATTVPARVKSPRKALPAVPIPATPQPESTEKALQTPVVATSGVLRITIDPADTKVFIDGTLLTRKEIAAGKRVTAGFHDIVAQVMGYEAYQRTLLIEADKTQILSIVLKQKQKGNGRLHVYSYPWSDLYIDGTYIGTTPTPEPITLIEGEHRVLLKHDGYKSYRGVVMVEKDEVTRVQVQMERIEGE
jgi:tRNA A-37 threonylcarbamoyl transferase component Bud32